MDALVCRTGACPAFEELVMTLSKPVNKWILDEYSNLLEEDPQYLAFHWMSTALKLQYQLKREAVPMLNIGSCIDESSRGCCVVDALKEAILRQSSRMAHQT